MDMPYICTFGGLSEGGFLGKLLLTTYALMSTPYYQERCAAAYIICQVQVIHFYVFFRQAPLGLSLDYEKVEYICAAGHKHKQFTGNEDDSERYGGAGWRADMKPRPEVPMYIYTAVDPAGAIMGFIYYQTFRTTTLRFTRIEASNLKCRKEGASFSRN